MKERAFGYTDLFNGEEVLASEIEAEGKVSRKNVDLLMREGKVIGQGMLPFDGEEDTVLFMPSRRQQAIEDAGRANAARHQDNLNRLHGYFYKGTYYHKGVGQPSNKKK